MSKMGISVISSYRGGCNFETVGLSRTVVNEFFYGVISKISGIGLTGIEKKIREIKQVKNKKGGTFYVSKSNVADSVRTALLGVLYFLGSKRSTDGENSI